MEPSKEPTDLGADLFGKPIPAAGAPAKDLGPGEHQEGHNEDLGLSLNDDEYEAFNEAQDEWAKEASAAKRAATEKEKSS